MKVQTHTIISSIAVCAGLLGVASARHDQASRYVRGGGHDGLSTTIALPPPFLDDKNDSKRSSRRLGRYGTNRRRRRTPSCGFAKHPYLMYTGHNDEMSVLWQAKCTTNAIIAWGLADSCPYDSQQTSLEVDATSHRHVATLSPLHPGRRYKYKVSMGGVQKTGYFHAAPPDDATDVKFLLYGDTRTYLDKHDAVAARMLSTMNADPSFQTVVFHGGDWVTSNTESDWTTEFFVGSSPGDGTNVREMLSRVPIHGCRGNHEGNGIRFRKYWPYPYFASSTKFYGSMDYGPLHVAFVDQYKPHGPGSVQYNWLRSDLGSTAKPWKMLVLHEPGWSAGPYENNSKVQNYIQPLCETYGVDLVVAGHTHNYALAAVNGVYHVETSGGGAPLRSVTNNMPKVVAKAKAYHFCEVSISGNRLDLTVRDVDGHVLHSFDIVHGAPPLQYIGTTCSPGGCARCVGKCGKDSHCAGGNLKCFQRPAADTTPVPGCISGGDGDVRGKDYCYDPNDDQRPNKLVYIGDCSNTNKCGPCVGDCDSNSQCASGLECFQRDARTAIPGCGRGGADDVSNKDYCYDPTPDTLPFTAPDPPTVCTSATTSTTTTTSTSASTTSSSTTIPTSPTTSSAATGTTSPTPPAGWEQVFYADFEQGWGIFNDGGLDAKRWTDGAHAHSGSAYIEIRDNTGIKSSVYTDPIAVSNYTDFELDFWFYASSMDNSNEDFFLEVSPDNGPWETVRRWAKGVHFENGVWYSKSVPFSVESTAPDFRIRFRCDASGNLDHVYIDDAWLLGKRGATSTTSSTATTTAPETTSTTAPPLTTTTTTTTAAETTSTTSPALTTTTTTTTTATTSTPSSQGLQPGVFVQYYRTGERTNLPDFDTINPYKSEIVPDINFPHRVGVFAGSGYANKVSALFTGYLNFPHTGTWTLYTNSDDGSKLFINGNLVVNNDGAHSMRMRSGTVEIASAQPAEVQVEFFENTGKAGLEVHWKGPGAGRTIVPASAWFHHYIV